MTDNIIRAPQVSAKTGYSRSSLNRLVKEGKFPQPIPLGARAIGWSENEVNEWVEQKIAAARTSRADRPTTATA